MPSDFEFTVTASVFDRLLDVDSDNEPDGAYSRAKGEAALRTAVRRDLEYLLNTRNPYPRLPAEFSEAGQSVLTYGLADFTNFNPKFDADVEKVRNLVESCIATFEPRLESVNVSVLPSGTMDRTLRLHVDARLLMDPVPEPISFDIVMPQLSSRYEVKERA